MKIFCRGEGYDKNLIFRCSKEQDKYEKIGDAIPPLLACSIAKELVKTLDKN